jgi:uncharacterized membrane protein
MAEIENTSGLAVPTQGLVNLTHLMYGLHAFSALMGILGPAFIITAFLTGWPSIIAVIINYVKRAEVSHTFLESHFRWQIRTFWFAVLWLVIMIVMVMTVIGIPIAIALGVGVGIWVLYRIIRGWMTLSSHRSMPI